MCTDCWAAKTWCSVSEEKNTNKQKKRLDNLEHMTQIPYITIKKTVLHIMSYTFIPRIENWMTEAKWWVTDKTTTLLCSTDRWWLQRIACSHVITWLFELIEQEYQIPCVYLRSISDVANPQAFVRSCSYWSCDTSCGNGVMDRCSGSILRTIYQ